MDTVGLLYKWEKSQKAGEESEKRCDLRRQQKMERDGSMWQITSDDKFNLSIRNCDPIVAIGV